MGVVDEGPTTGHRRAVRGWHGGHIRRRTTRGWCRRLPEVAGPRRPVNRMTDHAVIRGGPVSAAWVALIVRARMTPRMERARRHPPGGRLFYWVSRGVRRSRRTRTVGGADGGQQPSCRKARCQVATAMAGVVGGHSRRDHVGRTALVWCTTELTYMVTWVATAAKWLPVRAVGTFAAIAPISG
jgi:hypothetical protein